MNHDNEVVYNCDGNCEFDFPHQHLHVPNFIKVAEKIYEVYHPNQRTKSPVSKTNSNQKQSNSI